MREYFFINNYFSDDSRFMLNDGCLLKDSDYLFTKDIIVEGVHFLSNTDARLIAKKSIRVNLSDIAAMGGRPESFLIGLALPKNVKNDWVKNFSYGIKEDCKEFNVNVLGGDTTLSSSGSIFVSVTMIGKKQSKHILMRKPFCAGDLLCVSGTIGDSALALFCMQNNVKISSFLKSRYELPEPRISLGLALSEFADRCCAIDLSDGLLTSANILSNLSGFGITIFSDNLPISACGKKVIYENIEKEKHLFSLVMSCSDDYELLFTIPEKDLLELQKNYSFDHKISVIGQVNNSGKVTISGKIADKIEDLSFNAF